MTSNLVGLSNSKSESLIERHAWKILLGVSLLLGFFGVGDVLGGASDLQNGETVFMHSITASCTSSDWLHAWLIMFKLF